MLLQHEAGARRVGNLWKAAEASSRHPNRRRCRLQQAHTISHSGVAVWGMTGKRTAQASSQDMLHIVRVKVREETRSSASMTQASDSVQRIPELFISTLLL